MCGRYVSIPEPFSYAATLQGFHGNNTGRTFGDYKLECVQIQWYSEVSDPVQYCFEPDSLTREETPSACADLLRQFLFRGDTLVGFLGCADLHPLQHELCPMVSRQPRGDRPSHRQPESNRVYSPNALCFG